MGGGGAKFGLYLLTVKTSEYRQKKTKIGGRVVFGVIGFNLGRVFGVPNFKVYSTKLSLIDSIFVMKNFRVG